MSKIILQPSGNKDAREHFNDTIELPVKLSKIEKFLSQNEKDVLSQIYPENQCRIWG